MIMHKELEHKPREHLGRDIADTITKKGQEMSEYLIKTAEKRDRDIFKDIEIKLRDFLLLALIGISLGAIIIENIVGFIQFFQDNVTLFLGILGVVVGFIIGLVISSSLLR